MVVVVLGGGDIRILSQNIYRCGIGYENIMGNVKEQVAAINEK